MRLSAIIFQKIFPGVLLTILIVSFILVFDCCKPCKESQEPQEEEVMIEFPLSTTTNNETFCQLKQSAATVYWYSGAINEMSLPTPINQ